MIKPLYHMPTNLPVSLGCPHSPVSTPSLHHSTNHTFNTPSRKESSHAGTTGSRTSKSKILWKPPPDRGRLVLDLFLNHTPLPLEIIHIILNYACYYCRTHERRLGTISVNSPVFAQQFFSRSNGSLLYLRSPVLGHRPLQKIVFVMHHDVSFPWAESSPRTADSPCAWFEVARYRRSGRRHSIPPPKLRFATAHPVSSEWEEVPNTREILRFQPKQNFTSLNRMDSKLVGGMQPGEKVGVLVIAGRGTSVKHTIREMVIYLFCSW
ncbi:unnamed protein product [Rhizoctonia solani]|uniref:Uncharacterized protein n=1 Tax=Rhizoctonia solani TaxID=456999 RepID=A0A8H3D2F1_9AGAM|nr:unnamed protein product [Rhizoctonia solani]